MELSAGTGEVAPCKVVAVYTRAVSLCKFV